MSDAILEKLKNFVALKAHYDALVLEQYVVTDQVIASATTARLEAIERELGRWEGVYQYEVKALEGLCKCTTPSWQPGLAPSDRVAMVTA